MGAETRIVLMFKTLFGGFAAVVLLAAPVAAHDYKVGELSVAHPFIPVPKTRAMTAGGFFKVENTGAEADRLIAIETEAAARAEVHTTEHGTDGTAKMRHVEVVEIPAGEVFAFEQGGYHVMFMGLTKGLEEGDKIPATLIFEKAGRADVVFNVEAPKPTEAPKADAAKAHHHH